MSAARQGYVKIATDTQGNSTEVTKIPTVPANLAIAPSDSFLFDRSSKLSFEEGTPQQKIVASVDWTLGDIGATLRGTSYNSVLVANNNSTLDYETGSAVLLDLEGRYTFPMVSAALGVNNLTDEYPDATPINVNGATGSVGFPQYSPYGFNGRFLNDGAGSDPCAVLVCDKTLNCRRWLRERESAKVGYQLVGTSCSNASPRSPSPSA